MIETSALILSFFLAAQTAAPDAAQAARDDQAEEVAAAQKNAASDDDKVICKRTIITGSKFKKKICGTKKQWETLENRSSDAAREWQRRGKGLEPNDTNKPGT